MAAPSGTVWGSTSNNYVKIGLYVSTTSSNTQTKITVDVWLASKYSLYDANNTLYFDDLAATGSATTSRGGVTVDTTVDTGAGWSTSNHQKLYTYTKTYNRSKSNVKRYLYAKIINLYNHSDEVTLTASTTVTIPKLPSYTIAYNANNGAGAPSSQTKWYGTNLTLSSTKPTRTGYTFKNWNTKANGSGTSYAAGATYSANAAATLYAQWTAKTYTVAYNANGGTGAPSSQTKTHGTNITLSSTKPTRTNYTFKGWGTSASTTIVSYAAGATYSANANITLYAVWELAYVKPRIKSIKVSRCDSNRVVDDNGTYGLISFNFACDQTIADITISWESTSSGSKSLVLSDTSDLIFTTANKAGNVETIFGDGDLSSEVTSTITITVTDANGSSTAYVTLAGTQFTIDFKSGGKGIAMGKPAEHEDLLDVNFKAKFHKDVTIRRTVNNEDFTFNVWGVSKGSTSYWGMINPDGFDSGWIRTTSSGIIPHTQDGTNGKCGIGTSSWPFQSVHTKNLYTTTVNDTITLDTDGDIVIPNSKGYYAKSTSGHDRALIAYNGSDRTVVGYGGYSASEGFTAVYGNTSVNLISKGLVNITSPTAGLTSRAIGVNNVLWSGEYYMLEGQTITLSEAVSAQPNGIVLMWSSYANGAANNSDFNHTFIPKYHVLAASGKGVCCFITTGGLGSATVKYVYISDTTIAGNAVNNAAASETATGITKTPTKFVLRRVIGV